MVSWNEQIRIRPQRYSHCAHFFIFYFIFIFVFIFIFLLVVSVLPCLQLVYHCRSMGPDRRMQGIRARKTKMNRNNCCWLHAFIRDSQRQQWPSHSWFMLVPIGGVPGLAAGEQPVSTSCIIVISLVSYFWNHQ